MTTKTMTIKDLKETIKNLPDDMEIYYQNEYNDILKFSDFGKYYDEDNDLTFASFNLW